MAYSSSNFVLILSRKERNREIDGAVRVKVTFFKIIKENTSNVAKRPFQMRGKLLAKIKMTF